MEAKENQDITQLKYTDFVPIGKHRGRTFNQCVNYAISISKSKSDDIKKYIQYWEWFAENIKEFNIPQGFLMKLNQSLRYWEKNYYMQRTIDRKYGSFR